MKENIPGYPGYHITKDGKVYTHKSGSWKLRKTSNSSSTGRIRVRIHLLDSETPWIEDFLLYYIN